MAGGKIKKLAVVVVIGAAGAALFQQLRGRRAPQFSNHPTVTGGPAAAPDPISVHVAQPLPVLQMDPEPIAQLDTAPEREPAAEPAPVAAGAAEAAAPAWVEPIDGACPDGHPIKAKVKSGIYHVPGTPTYERTKPDRCYATVEAAVADGLRPPLHRGAQPTQP